MHRLTQVIDRHKTANATDPQELEFIKKMNKYNKKKDQEITEILLKYELLKMDFNHS